MYHIATLKRKNSRKYSNIKDLPEIEDVKKYLKENNLFYAGTPYIFTHINLSNGDIITQDYSGIICSPEKLRIELTK